MRLKLATKFSSAIVGVVALAVLSSVVTLLSARYMAGFVQDTVTENPPSLHAAEEVEIALLEQQNQIRRITWMVSGFVGLTIGLGAVLLWLFFHGVMSEVADTRSSLEQTRKQLMNAEKLVTAGKLAASGVAHEIRNPLTAVKMWLFSIRRGIPRTAELDRKFEIVSEEITRLENIVRNFLEFSRPPTLELQAQSVSLLIDKTLELLGHRIEEKRIRLVRDDAVDLPPVMTDTEQLKQVLINLLANAVDATSKGSEIRILVDMASGPGEHPMVVVRVQDTGTGMPQDVRERIFEPFYTTKQHGMGLGLCIAAGIMARHNGRLVLESSTEQGTTFAVRIPIAREIADEQNPGS